MVHDRLFRERSGWVWIGALLDVPVRVIAEVRAIAQARTEMEAGTIDGKPTEGALP